MPTLRDVAKTVGLSAATVSRALSGHPYVDERTRGRIVRAASELGYRPNALARALRVQTTRTIGLIIPDIHNDFYAESATVLQGAFEAHGYRLILCISNNDPAHDRRYLRTLAEHRVDGIVHVPSSSVDVHELEAGGRRIPVVELLRQSPEAQFDAVLSDDYEGAATLTRHLLALGHRRIAMLTGPATFSTTRSRVDGYRMALREAGFGPNDEFVLYGSYTPACGHDATRAVLARTPRPTAIFSSGSPLTNGVLRALAEARVRVPGDLSVVAYEDPDWYAISVPPLTCYTLPLREMGRVAADTIMARVADGAAPRPPAVLRFAGRLIVRESTAPPPG
ncbi:MAG: LacI family DNA-binding transcriptional regulator [Candidatus Eremiobacteraeota bacterium]|nr:LacI family DNA-binding transcriptional regulator [Candidatus Eremiobacteraeota bacterium]MBV9409777.1 LacI family DNA-binding transcriptional regulator [Candidatus Eremiobacteraeota bacterium]